MSEGFECPEATNRESWGASYEFEEESPLVGGELGEFFQEHEVDRGLVSESVLRNNILTQHRQGPTLVIPSANQFLNLIEVKDIELIY